MQIQINSKVFLDNTWVLGFSLKERYVMNNGFEELKSQM